MTEKKNRGLLSCGVILLTIVAGAIVTFSMYSLIQDSFFRTTVSHEMELMQIMENLGSELMDSRLNSLKADVKSRAKQTGKKLVSASEQEIREALPENSCYHTGERQYFSSGLQEDDVYPIDLSQAWEGSTVVFSPDFNEKGAYLMAIATPVWSNGQQDAPAGIWVEYVDGYSLSQWMGELFVSLDFGTAYLINEEGRNIGTAREENFDWITTRYNAQELAKESDDASTQSVARLEKRALDGEVGVDTYEWEGQLSYVAYGPLSEAPWGFCVGFYGSKFEAYTREVTAVSSRSAGVVLAVFLFFLAVILTIIVRNLRKERRYNQLLTRQKAEIEQQGISIAASEERFRIAMQRSSDIILECRLDTGELCCYYGDKEIQSGSLGDVSLRDSLIAGYCMDEDSFERFEEVMGSIRKGLTGAECTISGIAGDEKKWYKLSVTAVTGGALRPTRAVGILRDITSEHEAELDSLTRLYNQAAITEYVEATLQNHPQRNENVFIMVDIDHFKTINDQYGHPAGDKVLQEVAKALQAIFPRPCLCGRFGGDEFCVYCPQSPSRQELEKKLSALLKNIRKIGMKKGMESVVSISIGAVMARGHVGFEGLYQKADESLYQAKEAGRDRFRISEIN